MQWKDPRADWEGNEKIKRLVLREDGSELHDALCAESGGNCTYPPIVILENDLSCDEENDPECRLDMMRVVQVSSGIFYEYHRPPCVQLAYYDNAVQVNGRNTNNQMCANPVLPVATRMCCISDLKRSNTNGWGGWGATTFGYANAFVNFDGELVSYNTNAEFCNISLPALPLNSTSDSITSTVCSGDRGATLTPESPTGTTSYTYYHQGNAPQGNVWQWTNGGCALQMKVRSDGYVAIVHEPGSIKDCAGCGVTKYVDKEKTMGKWLCASRASPMLMLPVT